MHAVALAEALVALGEQVTLMGSAGPATLPSSGRSTRGSTGRVVPLPDLPGETVEGKVLRWIRFLAAHAPVRVVDLVHAQDCIAANSVDGGCLRTVHHLEASTTPVAWDVRVAFGRDATVIPNGVDAERSIQVDPALVGRWRDRLRGAPLVVALGGIEPRKGTHDLVEAMALLGGGARLVIGGGETLFDYRDYRVMVDATVAALGLDVQVLGPLPQEDVAPLLACADVVAMPSLAEGFGLTALEALAAGTPVVARDLPVFREVVGTTVRYGCDPATFADQLRAATTTAHGAAAGRALATSLTWERVPSRTASSTPGFCAATRPQHDGNGADERDAQAADMSLTRHDGHRHLGALPAFAFFGGPPINPAPQAPVDVAQLLADLDRERVERALVLPNYGVPVPEIAFQHNGLVLEACAKDDRVLGGLWVRHSRAQASAPLPRSPAPGRGA